MNLAPFSVGVEAVWSCLALRTCSLFWVGGGEWLGVVISLGTLYIGALGCGDCYGLAECEKSCLRRVATNGRSENSLIINQNNNRGSIHKSIHMNLAKNHSKLLLLLPLRVRRSSCHHFEPR